MSIRTAARFHVCQENAKICENDRPDFPNVEVAQPHEKQIWKFTNIFFTNMEAHTFSLTWKLTSPFFEKICMLCWTFPTKPGLPARIHTQSSKHGSCPIFRKGKMLGRMLGIMLHGERKQFLERNFLFIKVSS